MTGTEMIDGRAAETDATHTSDLKLEVVILPVSDVDRAKRFYESLGWRLDADFSDDTGWRVVQLTPPGSPCSIMFRQSRLDLLEQEAISVRIAERGP